MMNKEQAIKLLSKDTSPMEIHILTIEGLKQSEIMDKIQEAMDMGAEAIKNQTWISVKDRLPDNNTRVLVYCEWECEHMALRRNNKWYGEMEDFEDDDVLAWLPLPKPYIQSEADD